MAFGRLGFSDFNFGIYRGNGGLPMSHSFWRTEEQVEHVKLFFPKERGGGRIDDRRHIFESIENSYRAKKH